MTFVIPTAVSQMQADHDVDARARGVMTTAPGTINTKSNGGLPLTGPAATSYTHKSDGNERGLWWEFLATGGYNVSSAGNNLVLVWSYQYNAPNRVECDTVANAGITLALGTGTSSPPAVWRKWSIGGNDASAGKERAFPIHMVLDLEDTSYDSSTGTWDNTDIECFGFGSVQAHLNGTTNMVFFQRLFVFETTKGATNIPRFEDAGSDWDDIMDAMGMTTAAKITHGWLAREGTVFALACPVEFGDGSTTTNFDDNGVSVFWANNNDSANPVIRITENSFRVYMNLPSHATNGTADFSGYYDAGDSYPPWDFDQDDLAVVTFDGVTFNRTGTFKVGSSITGNATFNDCGVVEYQDDAVDLDGSTFKNPHAAYLVELP